MNKINTLALDSDKYKSKEEFENAIKNAIILLLDAGYIATIRYDANDKGLGIVVIDYDYADLKLGAAYPYWLYPEEAESIIYNDEGEADEV